MGAMEGILSTRKSCSITLSCPMRSYRTRVNGRKKERCMRAEVRRVCGELARSI